jgi:uncharacterized cupin superfamily protein
MKPIINIADAEQSRSLSHGDAFEVKMAPLAERIGAQKMGANVTTVPPGKAAFPIHHHHANEEHFFVLRGTGRLRCGGEVYDVRPGDYIVNPPGGTEHAHQLINTGSDDLVYLAMSTMIYPEVVGYPDSAKTGVRVSLAPDGRFLIRDGERNKTDYWDGEDGAQVRAVLKKPQGSS